MQILQDSFGRRFSYLRLSVTDACNFRCVYCLPDGYQNTGCSRAVLSVAEMRNLVLALSELGTWKVRLTGGEPTIRRDLLQIIQALSRVPGIRKIALSTNGYRLRKLAKPLHEAGVSALNISVDSLDRQKFHRITGQDLLPDILDGIETALKTGFSAVKVNTVLLNEWNSDDLGSFMEWVRDRPVSVRFIELMQTGQNQEFFRTRHISAQSIRIMLLDQGWSLIPRVESAGPAVEFRHPRYQGGIGIIAPYSKDFCATCNRLRVTSQGSLRLCLFGEGDFSLRHLLQSESQKDDLKEYILAVIQKKEISHDLPAGRFGNNQTFSAMGG